MLKIPDTIHIVTASFTVVDSVSTIVNYLATQGYGNYKRDCLYK